MRESNKEGRTYARDRQLQPQCPALQYQHETCLRLSVGMSPP